MLRKELTAVPLVLVLSLCGGWSSGAETGESAGGVPPDIVSPDFAREILPVLSDRCATCHGPDEGTREADLRLDLPAAIDAPTKNGGLEWVIKRGDAAASELVRRLRSEDPDERMPPPESKLSLSAAEIDAIARWIDAGAAWDQHWSFRPLVAPLLPPDPRGADAGVAVDGAGETVIDRWIEHRLRSAGIAASGEDSRYGLIRRLTLDLTGLPPTEEEIEQFVHDSAPDAYVRLVDRLLSRPDVGEQMAVAWLDAARYADTYGYQADVYREVWPWRDWVIEALSQSMPYDQFLTWQLAGDLLPEATRQSRLATTFSRLHRQTNEGGSVEEEFRAEYIADRVNTLGTSVLGLTLECARCHDHKYDPISQRNYYELAAFFANIDESGLYSHFTSYVPTPTLDLPTDTQEQQHGELEARVRAAEAEYERLWQQALARVAGSAAAPPASSAESGLVDEIAWYRFSGDGQALSAVNKIAGGPEGKWTGQPTVVPWREGESAAGVWGVQLSGEDGFATSAGGNWDWWQPMTIALWVRPDEHHERAVLWHRSTAWTDAASCGYELLLEDGRLSAAQIHFWPGDAIRVRAVEALPLQQWSHVTVSADGSGRAAGVRIYVDGKPIETIVVRDKLSRTIVGGGATELKLGNRFRDRGFKQGQLAELRIFARDLTPAEVLYVATGKVDEDPAAVAQGVIQSTDTELRESRQRLAQARADLVNLRSQIRAIMTMREEPGIHETFILRRGQYDMPGEKIEVPAVPGSFGFWTEDLPRDRLGLARWLTAPQSGQRHPLVARVAVNRFWRMFFDRGLVTTPEDFGMQGQPPSHPELLDALAAEWIEQGWDPKWLMRQIVLSAAYRRSERTDPQIRAQDPDNELLARGPSARLSIETIRDAALATAGLLDRTIGGPPVKPYQPPGLWEEKSGSAYHRDTGAGSHRRSLYTFWKRTSPPPSMMLFDAPGREVCAAGRSVTETPLQALVLLNDEQFVEAARGIAFTLLAGPASDDLANLNRLWIRMLGRPATSQEEEVLLQLILDQERKFAADPAGTEAFLKIGDFDHRQSVAGSTIDPARLAAWTIAAQTLMNLDPWVSR